MNLRPIAAALCAAGIAASCGTPAPEPFGALPTPEQLAWQRMETNMFVHFGPNTFTSAEWGDGREHPDVFAPSDLDCRQWAAIARDAGMKGIVITAKHHDGFCLWPNPASDHTVARSAWRDGKGDVLRELSDACREAGLGFGVYISPWDRNDPAYGTDAYNDVFRRTLESALGDYGEVFEQWFDGACGEGPNGKRQVYDWDLYLSTVFRLQPQAVVFGDGGPGCRWIGNERGIAGRTCWSTFDPDGVLPGGARSLDTLNCGNVRGSHWVPGEADVSIRPGWFYRESEDAQVKSLAELLKIYYASVGRNALLLLNVPPDKRGRIAAVDSLRLREFRAALDRIFAEDLAAGAAAEASNVRGGSRRFAAAQLLDDEYDTYWAADDTVRRASVTLRFDAPRRFNRVLLQEYIPLGQRVARFRIEALRPDGSWRTIARETTIGYKRIVLTETVATEAVRLTIDEALASPVLNRFALYMDEVTIDPPHAERDKQGRIVLRTDVPQGEIRYTLDGSLPGRESALYAGPVVEPGPCRLRAAVFAGDKTSSVAEWSWDIAPAAFRAVAPAGAEAVVDGLSDDGAEPVTRGVVLPAGEAVTLELGAPLTLAGFFYEPLAEGRGGCVVRYDLLASGDGAAWKTVCDGAAFDNIVNNPGRREVRFEAPLRTRYLRFVPRETSFAAGCGIGELGVLTR